MDRHRLTSRLINPGKGWLLFCFVFIGIFYFSEPGKTRKQELEIGRPEKETPERGTPEMGRNLDVVSVSIDHVMSGKPVEIAQDDERLLKYIWDKGILEPPSTLPYNISDPRNNPSGGQEQLVQEILGNMTNGFFVEVGGYDGEVRSNSLWLEMYLGWKGLLVEPDPRNWGILKTKNRKAWTANTCLSIHPYPHQAEFMHHYDMSRIVMQDEKIPNKLYTVQCIPLFSFLSALNVTNVDYFSLDVEGLELEILKTIPFDKVFIKTVSVEFLESGDKKGQRQLLKFMESKGYIMVQEIRKPKGLANDFIFVHKTINHAV